MRVRTCILFFLWNLLLSGHGLGADENGQAGRENPFTIGGFGARMLGMGNTGVAYPDDPSAQSRRLDRLRIHQRQFSPRRQDLSVGHPHGDSVCVGFHRSAAGSAV